MEISILILIIITWPGKSNDSNDLEKFIISKKG